MPDKGGHIDFCPEWAYNVASFSTACVDMQEQIVYDNINMHLYQCDHLSLKKNLREAYNDWKSGVIINKGNKTREHMIECLSSAKSINKIKNIMKELR